MYTLLLVFAALFLFAVLGFTIKFLVSRFKQICCAERRVVGIFSYSSPEDYRWITQGLTSPTFGSFVKSVFPSVISSSHRADFRQAVENCDFAILYHTKNRGRLNLTNVTDSLYDDELRHLSRCKGRLNVIVVIDDLEKIDYGEKHSILEKQPDIAEYARDLILVSSEDKRHQMGINHKLQQIGELMSGEYEDSVQYCDYVSSMARWFRKTVTHGSHRGPGEGLDAPLLV
ncbi:uncharacterized protein ACMZJ9_010682 [Mantella aurantiaca]